MRAHISYFLITFSLFVALWGCDGGDIYTSSEADLIAVEKLSKLSDDEINALIEECRADSKCRSEMEKYPGKESSSSKAISSSSKQEPESSSQKTSSSSESSSSSVVSSSSDIEQSSETEIESSSSAGSSSIDTSASSEESSSSVMEEESSSSDVVLSSSDLQSSSSDDLFVESSSSELEPLSSSSEIFVPQTSSSIESSSSLAPPKGECKVQFTDPEATEGKKNEPITIIYIPDEGTSIGERQRWIVPEASIIQSYVNSGYTLDQMKETVSFSEKGSYNYILRLNSNDVCNGSIQINDDDYIDPNASSSSNNDSPGTSSPSSTPSSSGGGTPPPIILE